MSLNIQAAASKDLERMKRAAEHTIPAYRDLYAAALSYYRALAPLEIGEFDLGAVETAEQRMEACEGSLLFVHDKFEGRWQRYWTQARLHKTHAATKRSRAERQDYWNDTAAKDLAGHIRELKASLQASFGKYLDLE